MDNNSLGSVWLCGHRAYVCWQSCSTTALSWPSLLSPSSGEIPLGCQAVHVSDLFEGLFPVIQSLGTHNGVGIVRGACDSPQLLGHGLVYPLQAWSISEGDRQHLEQ